MKTKRFLLAATLVASLGGCATKDADLVESAFLNIENQQWAAAEKELREALEINENNPFAMLNLGVVYENTGRPDEAREMYNRVIESDTRARAVKSNVSFEGGKRLTELAEFNLRTLDEAAMAP
jgi:Flp pilus assembly protein TadD